MNVVSLILRDGSELIAQQLETLNPTVLKLTKARKLQVVPNGQGGMGIALTPVFVSNSDAEDFDLDVINVVFRTAPHSHFEKQYMQDVSGIQLI